MFVIGYGADDDPVAERDKLGPPVPPVLMLSVLRLEDRGREEEEDTGVDGRLLVGYGTEKEYPPLDVRDEVRMLAP